MQVATPETGHANASIRETLALPRGARFYRCALHVNSYAYLQEHGKQTEYDSAAAYDEAMVAACKEHGVEVIAVTDHYAVEQGRSLVKAARTADLKVFPGFEAATRQGIHFLVLFDPDTDLDVVQRCIHRIVPQDEVEKKSPRADCHVGELLETCKSWEAACIAAHVCSKNGLLRELSGQPRIEAWQHEHLHAVSLPGPPEDCPQAERDILLGNNGDYRRPQGRLPAVVNAQDVDAPADLADPSTTTRIKMVEPTTEGLRQAFLDAESRILLNSDPEPEERDEFVAMTWEGGFLDGVKIHFNEDLNVLVGGRGAGKSTVIESLRYVLQQEPVGDDARQMHRSIVKNVLKSGTKVSLLVRLCRPSEREYLIERTVPNPPTVRDENGNVLDLLPEDLLPDIEIYGQHEISELAKARTELIRLLDRFVEGEEDYEQQKTTLRRSLADTRRQLVDIKRKEADVEERLSRLPAIEETLKQYEDAGIEEKLETQTKLVREEQVLKTARERISMLDEIRERFDEELPLDVTFLSEPALEDLPNADAIEPLRDALDTLGEEARAAGDRLESALVAAREQLSDAREAWEERQQQAQEQYEESLRELQDEQIDGDEYLRLRRTVEELRPLREKQKQLGKEAEEVQQKRRNLLKEYDDVKQQAYQAYEKACRRVSQSLGGRVKATVTFEGDRSPLLDLLDDQLDGRRKALLERLEAREDLSLRNLARCMAEGAGALQDEYDFTENQAKKLADVEANLRLQIAELDLPPLTQIMLNVAAEGENPDWRPLDDLSAGQKATAVLLLLLVESQTPLVVDQPEDDLDNRFVVEGVVPAVRTEKSRRQFLFATHNANIPVLGDAEQILGFTPKGGTSGGHAQIKEEHRGAIDRSTVAHLIEEVLEGGETAFERRRLKYGF